MANKKPKIESLEHGIQNLIEVLSNPPLDDAFSVRKYQAVKLIAFAQYYLECIKAGARLIYTFELATGTGKTVMFSLIPILTKGKSLIVVPKALLIKQTIDKIKWLSKDQIKEIDATDTIKLDNRKAIEDHKILITTYAYLSRNVEKVKSKTYHFDLFKHVIFDESHYLDGPQITDCFQFIANNYDCLITKWSATPGLDKRIDEDLTIPKRKEQAAEPLTIPQAIDLGANVPVMIAVVIPDTTAKIQVQVGDGDINQNEFSKAINKPEFNYGIVSLYMNGIDNLSVPFRGDQGVVFCAGVNHAIDVAKAFNGVDIEAVDPNNTLRNNYRKNVIFQNLQLKFAEEFKKENITQYQDIPEDCFTIHKEFIESISIPPFKTAAAIYAPKSSKDRASSSRDYDLTHEESDKILEQYKLGGILLLTGAEILVEGFDYSEVSLVMRVSETLSWKKMVQCAGRGERLSNKNPNKVLRVLDWAWPKQNKKRLNVKYFYQLFDGFAMHYGIEKIDTMAYKRHYWDMMGISEKDESFAPIVFDDKAYATMRMVWETKENNENSTKEQNLLAEMILANKQALIMNKAKSKPEKAPKIEVIYETPESIKVALQKVEEINKKLTAIIEKNASIMDADLEEDEDIMPLDSSSSNNSSSSSNALSAQAPENTMVHSTLNLNQKVIFSGEIQKLKEIINDLNELISPDKDIQDQNKIKRISGTDKVNNKTDTKNSKKDTSEAPNSLSKQLQKLLQAQESMMGKLSQSFISHLELSLQDELKNTIEELNVAISLLKEEITTELSVSFKKKKLKTSLHNIGIDSKENKSNLKSEYQLQQEQDKDRLEKHVGEIGIDNFNLPFFIMTRKLYNEIQSETEESDVEKLKKYFALEKPEIIEIFLKKYRTSPHLIFKKFPLPTDKDTNTFNEFNLFELYSSPKLQDLLHCKVNSLYLKSVSLLLKFINSFITLDILKTNVKDEELIEIFTQILNRVGSKKRRKFAYYSYNTLFILLDILIALEEKELYLKVEKLLERESVTIVKEAILLYLNLKAPSTNHNPLFEGDNNILSLRTANFGKSLFELMARAGHATMLLNMIKKFTPEIILLEKKYLSYFRFKTNKSSLLDELLLFADNHTRITNFKIIERILYELKSIVSSENDIEAAIKLVQEKFYTRFYPDPYFIIKNCNAAIKSKEEIPADFHHMKNKILTNEVLREMLLSNLATDYVERYYHSNPYPTNQAQKNEGNILNYTTEYNKKFSNVFSLLGLREYLKSKPFSLSNKNVDFYTWFQTQITIQPHDAHTNLEKRVPKIEFLKLLNNEYFEYVTIQLVDLPDESSSSQCPNKFNIIDNMNEIFVNNIELVDNVLANLNDGQTERFHAYSKEGMEAQSEENSNDEMEEDSSDDDTFNNSSHSATPKYTSLMWAYRATPPDSSNLQNSYRQPASSHDMTSDSRTNLQHG